MSIKREYYEKKALVTASITVSCHQYHLKTIMTKADLIKILLFVSEEKHQTCKNQKSCNL